MSADLYQQRLLELANFDAGRLEAATVTLSRDNPLCGDRITLDLCRDVAGRITALGYEVRGCVLCRAAATLLGQQGVGHDRAALAALHAHLGNGLRRRADLPTDAPWQDLALFEPVTAYKSRHECVLLPFETVIEALAECSDSGAEAAN